MVLSKKPMCCQFINAQNKPISEVFNFNNNIQIGDASQVFYSTLYTSKSTQDEDSEKQLRIGRAVIIRMKRLLEENQTNGCDQASSEPSFGEGLSKVLSGMSSVLQWHISYLATMDHVLPFCMIFQIC